MLVISSRELLMKKDLPCWTKVDAKFVAFLSSLKQIFLAHETSAGVWEQAWLFYINHTQCLPWCTQSLEDHSPSLD